MLNEDPTYRAICDQIAELASQQDGCNRYKLLGLGHEAKRMIDRALGLGNWYSGMITNTMSRALETFDGDLPKQVAVRMDSIALAAGNANRGEPPLADPAN